MHQGMPRWVQPVLGGRDVHGHAKSCKDNPKALIVRVDTEVREGQGEVCAGGFGMPGSALLQA